MISDSAFDGAGDGTTADGDVVVGFDGSPSAWEALRWAADDAGTRRAALEVVCCVADTSAPTAATAATAGTNLVAARQQLDEAAWVAGIRGLQIRVHASLAEGRPGDVLVDRSRGAAELVLGRHDPGPIPVPGRESLSAYCRTNAVCPVTVVDSTSQPGHPSAPGPVTTPAAVEGDE
jgi:nucleotide-binding universal stress UspA family protein